jgi:hypothetical protein
MQLFGDILHGASLSKFSFIKKCGKKNGKFVGGAVTWCSNWQFCSIHSNTLPFIVICEIY